MLIMIIIYDYDANYDYDYNLWVFWLWSQLNFHIDHENHVDKTVFYNILYNIINKNHVNLYFTDWLW